MSKQKSQVKVNRGKQDRSHSSNPSALLVAEARRDAGTVITPIPCEAATSTPRHSVAEKKAAELTLELLRRHPSIPRSPTQKLVKWALLNLSSAVASWDGLLFSLMGSISQGDDYNQRVGDSLKVIKWRLRGWVVQGSAASPTADCTVQITVNESIVPGLAITAFYAETGSAFAAITGEDSSFREATRRVGHRSITLHTYHPRTHFEFGSDRPFDTLYNANATTVVSGELNVAVVSNKDPASATTNPTFIGDMQVWFVDV